MKKETTGGGLGLSSILFIVFLILKLTHAIDWSWWWVTSPLWLPILIAVVALCILIIIAGISEKY